MVFPKIHTLKTVAVETQQYTSLQITSGDKSMFSNTPTLRVNGSLHPMTHNMAIKYTFTLNMS